jgi:hypothetical protein
MEILRSFAVIFPSACQLCRAALECTCSICLIHSSTSLPPICGGCEVVEAAACAGGVNDDDDDDGGVTIVSLY